MDKKIIEVLSAIGGAIVSFVCGLPPILWVLLAVMSLDYLSGLLCGFMGKSPKTPNGGLSSSEAFRGLLKKTLILAVVGLSALIDRGVSVTAGVEIAAVTGATCLWFVASEGLSILENAASMEIPIPSPLLKSLELLKKEEDQR